MSPITKAPIEANKTAPADKSLTFLICSFFSLEKASERVSIAEFIISSESIKIIDNIKINHSKAQIFNIKPKIITKNAIDDCIIKLRSPFSIKFKPRKA